MNALLVVLTKLVTLIVNYAPVVGPWVKQYLPADKPTWESATVKAGVLWGLLESLCLVVPLLFPPAAPVCASVAGVLHVLGPVLMLLGVRKAVVAPPTGPPPPKP